MRVVRDIDVSAEAIAQGDPKAFEQLFREYYPPLCSFANSYLKSQTLAEELVQDFFCSFWDKRQTLKAETSLKSYLYASVRNRCLNHLRDEKRREQLLAEDVDQASGNEASVSEQLEYQELQEKVGHAITQLPTACRQVFELNRYEGLKYKEIAEQLSISVKTVENQMGKALKMLRKALLIILFAILLKISSSFFSQGMGVLNPSGVFTNTEVLHV